VIKKSKISLSLFRFLPFSPSLYLQDGDICAITSNWKYDYTSHVGLIMKIKGRAYFAHATSDHDKGRMACRASGTGRASGTSGSGRARGSGRTS